MTKTPPSLQDYLQDIHRLNPGSFLREVLITLIAGLIIGAAFLLSREQSPWAISGRGTIALGMATSVIITMISRYGIMRPTLQLLGRMVITLLGAAALSLLCFVPLMLAGPETSPGLLVLNLLGSVTAALVLEEVSGLRVFSSHLLAMQAYERHLRYVDATSGPQDGSDRPQDSAGR